MPPRKSPKARRMERRYRRLLARFDPLTAATILLARLRRRSLKQARAKARHRRASWPQSTPADWSAWLDELRARQGPHAFNQEYLMVPAGYVEMSDGTVQPRQEVKP